MAIITYKPTSPGRRSMTAVDNRSVITRSEPERRLTKPKRRTNGRNNQGRITVRHRGGGHRRKLRLIDFKRVDKTDVKAKVASVEYDPNRTSLIALLHYVDGDKRYILAPVDVKVGDVLIASATADIRPGNHLPLKGIPLGTAIHNVELKLGKGGQLVRSAGSSAQLMAKEGDYAQLRMPSGEVRRIRQDCLATVGVVGNAEHSLVTLGKAGRTRHRGRRPEVRGSAMTPRDHPHGGGEGKAPIGMPGPKTPWGKPTLGYKTRKNKRTNRFIVRRRGDTRG